MDAELKQYRNGKLVNTVSNIGNEYYLKNCITASFILADKKGHVPDKVVIEYQNDRNNRVFIRKGNIVREIYNEVHDNEWTYRVRPKQSHNNSK